MRCRQRSGGEDRSSLRRHPCLHRLATNGRQGCLRTRWMNMLSVGLTGSIAVGKSFVLGVLSELGCRVLDADETAREVVAPGTAGLQAVIDNFGHDVLRSDGTLDRAKLGTIIFNAEAQR